MTPSLAPIAEQQRLKSLDVLRGFAVLGILMMNVGLFSMPAAAYFAPVVYGDLNGMNGVVWTVTHLLTDMKFMGIFSMLFGAGIILMSERCEARGKSPAGIHYRRVAWLAVFGVLHAYLLWNGDILYWYGICGLFVYVFRKRSPFWLIAWGLLFVLITSAIMIGSGLSAPSWPSGMQEYINAGLRPSPDAIAEEIAAYRGSWLEQMQERAPKALELQTSTLVSWAFWRISGLMLLGMALFKLGVFSAARSHRFYWALVAVAASIGLPIVYLGIQYQYSIDWEAPQFFFIGTQLNYWASILVSLGWVGAVMLVCKSEKFTVLTNRLAAVGRAAFSNYILQTVICTTIFYGHGLGYFGQIERTGQLAIVIAIWVLQLSWSPVWLRHFNNGPLEWLWRSLTYRQFQPLRRQSLEK